MRGTYFEHKLDNKVKPLDCEWPDLVALLLDATQVERAVVEKDGLTDPSRVDAKGRPVYLVWPSCPAICPAEYSGELRRKAEVVRWHWFGADVDNDGGDDAGYLSIDDMKAILDDLGLGYVIHSTTKSRPDRHRYRLILPLTRPIEAFEFAEVWSSISQMFGGVFDSATKDPSRLFFVPAQWEGADNRFELGDGEALDVDWCVGAFPPEVIQQNHFEAIEVAKLPEVVGQVAQVRAALLSGATDWRDVLDPDKSPFVSDWMRQDYASSAAGGRFFKFMKRVAVRALRKGYPITDREVEAIGLAFDRLQTGKRRFDSLREARRALAIAASKVATERVGKTPVLSTAPVLRSWN